MKPIHSLKDAKGSIGKAALLENLPYDHPSFFLDEVTFIDEQRASAHMEITGDEEMVRGHFKGFPIIPGAILIEAMGQLATLVVRYGLESHHEHEVVAYKISDSHFYKPTFPKQTILLRALKKGVIGKKTLIIAQALVGDVLHSQATFTLAAVNKEEFRKGGK